MADTRERIAEIVDDVLLAQSKVANTRASRFAAKAIYTEIVEPLEKALRPFADIDDGGDCSEFRAGSVEVRKQREELRERVAALEADRDAAIRQIGDNARAHEVEVARLHARVREMEDRHATAVRAVAALRIAVTAFQPGDEPMEWLRATMAVMDATQGDLTTYLPVKAASAVERIRQAARMVHAPEHRHHGG